MHKVDVSEYLGSSYPVFLDINKIDDAFADVRVPYTGPETELPSIRTVAATAIIQAVAGGEK